jgi:hypothetical protein
MLSRQQGEDYSPMNKLQPANPVRTVKVKDFIKQMMAAGYTRVQAKDAYNDSVLGDWYKNDTYTVIVREGDTLPPDMNPLSIPDVVWISLRRNDREPVTDWRDKQEIKNQLLGPECEAMEIFPAESRCVDLANQFHLFGIRDLTARIPFGFQTREVDDELKVGKSEQRKLKLSGGDT